MDLIQALGAIADGMRDAGEHEDAAYLDRAAAALEAAREDAEDAARWRFVREQSPATIRLDGNMRGSGLPDGLVPSYYRANTASELDAAIDQARGKGVAAR